MDQISREQEEKFLNYVSGTIFSNLTWTLVPSFHLSHDELDYAKRLSKELNHNCMMLFRWSILYKFL